MRKLKNMEELPACWVKGADYIDSRTNLPTSEDFIAVARKELREEAIKWARFFKYSGEPEKTEGIIRWIVYFFNISEEELK